ncbi:uncharacterized protein BYT42DRAFT_574459 [Radiomyces spectabilis]|uniref:uncharacterized protein n=1 Tax=Radiomyces spectabilis TaxID=64574 RepID=UPI00221E78D5|nr:uncharacterized protein BYT42DRAFT_574459 [Radiomyces spectabilis]KAI8376397.1 hypothetical protein BYT42DRAFT_574459 [Radiomyces spectabilis]
MMYRLFKSDLSNPENIVLKYTDDEGDMISMTDDVDISHAISQSNLLKITVFDKETRPFMGSSNSYPRDGMNSELVSKLTSLRDTLNELIHANASSTSSFSSDKITEGAAPEKTYRQLSTSELAEFLEETQGERQDGARKNGIEYPSLPKSSSQRFSVSAPSPSLATKATPSPSQPSQQQPQSMQASTPQQPQPSQPPPPQPPYPQQQQQHYQQQQPQTPLSHPGQSNQYPMPSMPPSMPPSTHPPQPRPMPPSSRPYSGYPQQSYAPSTPHPPAGAPPMPMSGPPHSTPQINYAPGPSHDNNNNPMGGYHPSICGASGQPPQQAPYGYSTNPPRPSAAQPGYRPPGNNW